MDTENRAFRLERRSSHAGKTLRQAIELSAARLVIEGEIPVKGLSDQLNAPCRALRRWAADIGLATLFWTNFRELGPLF